MEEQSLASSANWPPLFISYCGSTFPQYPLAFKKPSIHKNDHTIITDHVTGLASNGISFSIDNKDLRFMVFHENLYK